MRLFADASADVRDPVLRRALELAERGRGSTSPNPMVGCVIAHGDEVVGEGFHARAGEAHAEVVALRAAGSRASGATAYVTLEPCNHFGKTPPCTEALLAAGVARVVIGMPDPNVDVSGGGAARLREQGIDVSFADDPAPYEELNEAWLKRMRTGLPWLRVKVAASLDGHASAGVGVRSRVTGAGGSALTRLLRARSTAVCVGASTAVTDDPLLTVRQGAGSPDGRQPMRLVLSRTTVPPASMRLFQEKYSGVGLVISAEVPGAAVRDLENAGVSVLRYDLGEGLQGALRAIAASGVDDVLVEAGPGLLSAMWQQGLIDELYMVYAGGMFGVDAPALYAGAGDLAGHDLAAPMRAVEAGIMEDDAVVAWRPYDDGDSG